VVKLILVQVGILVNKTFNVGFFLKHSIESSGPPSKEVDAIECENTIACRVHIDLCIVVADLDSLHKVSCPVQHEQYCVVKVARTEA